MFEMMMILLSLALVLVAIGGGIWGLYRLGHWVNQVPAQLRGHLFAAVVWTLITLCQTIILLNYRATPNIVGHLVVFIAGWVMISSWAQFVERGRELSYRQSRRWLLHRLFVQTLWGPLALWLAIGVFCHYSQLAFTNALDRRDTSNALLLKHYGLGNFDHYFQRYRIMDAVEQGDVDYMATLIGIGVQPNKLLGLYCDNGHVEKLPETSREQKNPVVVRFLVKSGASPEASGEYFGYHLLHNAASSGDIRVAQVLLQYGAKRKVYNSAGKTPFQLAEERKDAEMVALLSTYPAK